jgi:hypothetical protein
MKTTMEFPRFMLISGKRTSSNREIFLELSSNPAKYRGYIVYITEVDDDELYFPFEEPRKFYFNEGGEWQSSDLKKDLFEEE